MEKHSFIVIFKTAYYSFYLPVALAMYMSGINDEKDLKQVRDILIPLGEYFKFKMIIWIVLVLQNKLGKLVLILKIINVLGLLIKLY